MIGTLATGDAGPVDVVTGDRDLFQLVDDSRAVRVLYVARGVGRADVVDEACGDREVRHPGARVRRLRDPARRPERRPARGSQASATRRRPPSSRGTAPSPALLAALDSGDTAMPAGARTKLAAAGDYLAVAPKVVAVAADVPLPRYDDGVPAAPRDPDRLVELSQRWGLDSPLNRVLSAFAAVHSAA